MAGRTVRSLARRHSDRQRTEQAAHRGANAAENAADTAENLVGEAENAVQETHSFVLSWDHLREIGNRIFWPPGEAAPTGADAIRRRSAGAN